MGRTAKGFWRKLTFLNNNKGAGSLFLISAISVGSLLVIGSLMFRAQQLLLIQERTAFKDVFTTINHSLIDYTLGAIKNRWCIDTQTWLQESEMTCKINSPGALERMLLSRSPLSRSIHLGFQNHQTAGDFLKSNRKVFN